ncbi:hypothetical protein [Polyangium jinanense]|uniref:Uncharacterized protein n=1 Tax=Polyangium jinanense TaxID=2829994 RepID=A0A9X4AY55_9BACT|nr:hypothetical protein [Polyangium jinanense]MDC3961419.1 hypothetical protein [Polyangium jinanense]MDC3987020.1 hypothetical protein [Polyangium jinanense]
MDSAYGASNPFATDSMARVIVFVRRMVSISADLRRPAVRAGTLIHLAAAARALERRYLGSVAREGELSGEILSSLRSLVGAREDCEAGPAGALLVTYLEERLAAEESPAPRAIARIAERAEGLFGSVESARIHRFSIELASGRRREALERARALPKGWLRERALARIEDGIEQHPGRERSYSFVGNLDSLEEARMYRPSLPLVRELFVMGGEASRIAEEMRTRIEGSAGQEARALLAIARYPERGPAGVIALLRAVRHRNAWNHGWLGAIGAALHAERLDHAEALLAHAPGRYLRGRAELAIAAFFADHGERLAARRRIQRVEDPALAPAIQLLLARLDLDAGLVRRAEKRVVALPMTLLVPPRRAALHEPRLPGEPEPMETKLAREAWLVRIGIFCARTGYGRDALLPRELVARAFDDASLRRVLFRNTAYWNNLLHPDEGEPHEVRWWKADVLNATRITEHCLDLLESASTLRDTLADLDVGGHVTPEAAFALGALGPTSSWDRCRLDPRFRDALGAARAHYDEGISFTNMRKRRRVALIDAGRAYLRRVLDKDPAGGEEARAATTSRIRCLQNLGGEQATIVLQHALVRSVERSGHAQTRRTLFGALAALAPQRATEIFVEQYEVFARDRQAPWAATQIEARGLFPPGTASAHGRTFTRLMLRLGDRASTWLADFVRTFTRDVGTPPGPEVLAIVDTPDLPATGEERVRQILERREALFQGDPEDFVRGLAEEPDRLRLLSALCPVSPGHNAAVWSEHDWQRIVERLQKDVGPVAVGPIARLRRHLPGADQAVQALVQGAPPVPALARPLPLGSSGVLVLRYLDKRRDFAAFLRFADCVPCCFNSTSSMYAYGRDVSTQRMVLSLWKDPLSFCFQVVRAPRAGVAEAQGFVFGGFGLCEDGPAVLLNGLYLRRQMPWLRFAIVEAIEQALCRPLGIRLVAIATRYGGLGPLPPDYTTQPRRVVHRLRALCEPNGVLMTRVYDDLSSRINGDVTSLYGIYWRKIA